MTKEQLTALKTKIEQIQSIMIAYVTDGRENSQPDEYLDLYSDLDIEFENTDYPNPNQHKTLEIFWGFCKLQSMGTWAERRAYVQELYADIVLDLTRKIKKGKDPRNWTKTNELLQDEFFPVRVQWLKAKNFIFSNPPDFENSIKESINSIESTLKILLNEPKGTLGTLLNKVKIDPDVKRLISQAYGLVSNKDFVRHGGMQPQNLSEAEAVFFLEFSGVSIAYLKTTLRA